MNSEKRRNHISRVDIPQPQVPFIWPASHEKGPSDISHSVDQDQPLYDVENTYT